MSPLIANLAEISGIGAQMIWGGFVVFLRVGAVMALLPAFGEQSVPQRIRLVLALAFTAIVAPAVVEKIGPYSGSFVYSALVEVVAGLALGICLRMFVLALQITGAIAAQAASLSQLFGGAAAEPQPAIGNILIVGALALAVMNGFHVRAAQLLVLSYDMLPAGRLPDSADLATWGLHQVVRATSLAFSLAAPFVFASLVFNLALGFINRAMPHLMVAFVGAPALTFGGLVMLAVIAPVMLMVWVDTLNTFFAQPFEVGQ